MRQHVYCNNTKAAKVKINKYFMYSIVLLACTAKMWLPCRKKFYLIVDTTRWREWCNYAWSNLVTEVPSEINYWINNQLNFLEIIAYSHSNITTTIGRKNDYRKSGFLTNLPIVWSILDNQIKKNCRVDGAVIKIFQNINFSLTCLNL